MLQVLSHADIGEVSVVIIRYFGGTKLGTGGLARAYGDAIKAVLADCPTMVKLEQCELGIGLPYDLSGKIEHLCQSHGGEIIDRQYGQQLQLRIKLLKDKQTELCQALGAWPEVEIK
jgi:putative IMPACT (imprinted ancient) family translation regulator